MISLEDFDTHEQAKTAVFEYIEVFYNRHRCQSMDPPPVRASKSWGSGRQGLLLQLQIRIPALEHRSDPPPRRHGAAPLPAEAMAGPGVELTAHDQRFSPERTPPGVGEASSSPASGDTRVHHSDI